MKQQYIKPEMSVELLDGNAVMISASDTSADPDTNNHPQLAKDGASFSFEEEDSNEDY